MTQSMMFWVLSALLALVVLVALIVPFLRHPRKALARAEYDLAIYKDQLRELEEEVKAGAIPESEAAAARNEIARRILGADTARKKAEGALNEQSTPAEKAIAALAAIVLVPALAYGVYLQKGAPDMPDMPIAKRMADAARHNDVTALIRRVEERLARHPDDIQGWLALAPVYSRQGRYAKAANAWRNAIRLSKTPDADLYNALGESLVYANNGKLVKEARTAFTKALKLAPGNPMSRYFLAQADIQDGKRDKALAALKKLLKDLPKDFGGRGLIERQIAALEGKPATAQKSAAAPSRAGQGGPTQEQIKARLAATKDMSPQARQEMIRNMVDGLEQKLSENPDNLGGWLRLIKARVVLGQKARAQAAYEAARKAFAGQDKRIRALDSLATAQGLKVAAPVHLAPAEQKPAPARPARNEARAAPAADGPTAEQVRQRMQRMKDMSPQARQEMIRNMVDGLEQKLDENPDNLGGWLRLIKARTVLGEKDKARAALEKARQAFAGKPEALGELGRLSEKLGL